MLRWLEQARAGSGEGLERVRAACGERLLAIASEDLPGDSEGVRALVNEALRKLPVLLSSFDGASEQELRSWLRQILFDQLETLPGPGSSASGSAVAPDEATRGHGSGNTPQTPASEEGDALRPQTSEADGTTALPGGVPGSEPPTVVEANGVAPGPGTDLFLPGMPQFEGFEDVTKITAGGMGVVYKARQLRPKRWVALKVLPPEFAEDPERLRRFRQEIELSAKLTEQGIVHVYDVLEVDQTPVLVMPFIDGCDLNKILTQRRKLRGGEAVPDAHPLALASERDFLAWLLPFFDKVLDVLVNLHGAGVLHRDLKPSNILVDNKGLGWLTDFGLARRHRADPADKSSKAMGTFGFMSPEQWSGEPDVDVRADVFGMGVTIYQALTLEFPYGRGPINEQTPAVQITEKLSRSWPDNLDLVTQKALRPQRELRYGDATEFRDDWLRVRKRLLPRSVEVGAMRRVRHNVRRWWIPATAVAAAALATVFAALLSMPPRKIVRTVSLRTEPPGARVAMIPLDPVNGSLLYKDAIETTEKTPTVLRHVPIGDYLVIAEVAGYGFHEVFRHVPIRGELTANPMLSGPGLAKGLEPSGDIRTALEPTGFAHIVSADVDGIVELPRVRIPKSDVIRGMVLFRGGEFTMGDSSCCQGSVRSHPRTVDPYFLDPTEVTFAEYKKVRGGTPAKLDSPPEDESWPVHSVTFDEAVRCAEEMGKRLPDEAEYEFAATNGGQTRFPWGQDLDRIKAWKFGPVRSTSYDRARDNPSVYGLFSNVAEWTMSRRAPYPGEVWSAALLPTYADDRMVRGGPYTAILGKTAGPHPRQHDLWDAHYREGMNRDRVSPGVGFRCARSQSPRFPDSGQRDTRKNALTPPTLEQSAR
jgi:tRNA A-37 threonylcarbamoyl transferase component Bud32